MPKENKSNKVTFEERVSVVTEMLLAGLKRREILQNVATNEKMRWKVEDRQIDEYIAHATKIILKPIEKNREKLKSEANSKLHFLYKKLVAARDYRGAVLVIEKLNLLSGLNAPIEINNKNTEVTISFTGD